MDDLTPSSLSRPHPIPSLWADWSRLRILALAIGLIAANFFFQVLLFSTGGGLYLPVLGGAVAGVFLPLLALARQSGISLVQDFRLHLTQPLVLTLAVLTALASLVPTSMLAELSTRIHPADPQWVAFYQENMPSDTWGKVMILLVAVVLAPLAEEVIFRGLLHRLASRTWGMLPAIAISSLVFGIIHGEPWFLFGLVGVGIVLAVIYETTGSLVACWVAHGVHNGVSLLLMFQQEGDFASPTTLTSTEWLWTGGSLATLGILFAVLFRIRDGKRLL